LIHVELLRYEWKRIENELIASFKIGTRIIAAAQPKIVPVIDLLINDAECSRKKSRNTSSTIGKAAINHNLMFDFILEFLRNG
jgi:hypothetical protein